MSSAKFPHPFGFQFHPTDLMKEGHPALRGNGQPDWRIIVRIQSAIHYGKKDIA
jgi:hypothetical protein